VKPCTTAPNTNQQEISCLIVALSLGVTSITALVLASLLTTLFVDGGSLLDTRIMRLELDTGVWREVEDVFHGLSVGKRG
jgi:hypothetical protein